MKSRDIGMADITPSPWQLTLDKADHDARAGFITEATALRAWSAPGGYTRHRWFHFRLRRYKDRQHWESMTLIHAGNIFAGGWEAAKRHYGVDQEVADERLMLLPPQRDLIRRSGSPDTPVDP